MIVRMVAEAPASLWVHALGRLPSLSKLRDECVRQICTEIAKRACEPTGRYHEVATSSEFGRSRHPQPPCVASPDDARVTLADPVCPGQRGGQCGTGTRQCGSAIGRFI